MNGTKVGGVTKPNMGRKGLLFEEEKGSRSATEWTLFNEVLFLLTHVTELLFTPEDPFQMDGRFLDGKTPATVNLCQGKKGRYFLFNGNVGKGHKGAKFIA